jgi:hypothetical protein
LPFKNFLGTAGGLAQYLLQRQNALRMHQLQHAQLKMKSLLLAISKLIEGAQHDLKEPGKVFLRKLGGNPAHARAFV